MDEYQKSVKKGIRTVLDVVNPGMNISNNALRVIILCLSQLNERLVEKCKRESIRKHKSQGVMAVTVAHRVVNNIFIGQMRNCAAATAQKSVLKYNAGILVYVPRKRVEKKHKIKKRKTKILPAFIKGIQMIGQMVNHDIVIQTDAKKLVALILQQLAKTIAEKAQQTSKGQGVVEMRDVSMAVENCMTASMAKHAIAEAARNIFAFRNGLNEYNLEDFKILRKKIPKEVDKDNRKISYAVKRLRKIFS